jgi:DNA gyrase subunit B
MYIGGTDDRALRHMVYEVLDHFAEEGYLARCNNVSLELYDERRVIISGDDAGLPIASYRDTAFTQLEAIMQGIGVSKTEFGSGLHLVMGGLHGVGIAVVNALSSHMEVITLRDGYMWKQQYEKGKPITELERKRVNDDIPTRTTFTFIPDPEIFDEKFDFTRNTLLSRCRDICFQTPDLRIVFRDQRVGADFEAEFHFSNGLRDKVIFDVNRDELLHDPIHIQRDVTLNHAEKADYRIGIEIAFVFTTREDTDITGYVNTVETRDGGTHMAALRTALQGCIDEYLDQQNSEESLTWKQLSRGLRAVISIRHPDPQFMSPTKIRLGNSEIYGPVAGLIFENFNPYTSYKILSSIVDYHLLGR